MMQPRLDPFAVVKSVWTKIPEAFNTGKLLITCKSGTSGDSVTGGVSVYVRTPGSTTIYPAIGTSGSVYGKTAGAARKALLLATGQEAAAVAVSSGTLQPDSSKYTFTFAVIVGAAEDIYIVEASANAHYTYDIAPLF